MSDQTLVPANDPYPMRVKVEAVSLVWETGNFSAAARRMKELHPERPPTRQVIAKWAKQADPERYTKLEKERQDALDNNITELGLRATERFIDVIESMPDKDIPIGAGIAIDKSLRLREIRQRANPRESGSGGPFVIFIQGTDSIRLAEPALPTIEAQRGIGDKDE